MVRVAVCWEQSLRGDEKSGALSRDIYGMSEEARFSEISVAVVCWTPVDFRTLVESHVKKPRLAEKCPAWTKSPCAQDVPAALEILPASTIQDSEK